MEKREAKRIVCYRLSAALKTDVGTIGNLMVDAHTEQEVEVFEQAIHELARELEGRGVNARRTNRRPRHERPPTRHSGVGAAGRAARIGCGQGRRQGTA